MKLINKHISSSLIILLVFATIITACHQDVAEPDVEVGEVRRVVTAQEIPGVTKALVNQMGLNNGDQRFSVNNGQSQDLLNIDWDEILQLVDSTGDETYTFRIEDNDDNPFVFYNLVIRFNAFGDPFSPFLVKYEMSEDFIPQYLETGSMSNFSGKISKIVINPSNSDYNRGSVNAGPQAPRMINENPDCPPEDIYMDNGTTGGGGGPGGGPGGGGTGGGGGSYRVCESYTQDILWISSVCDSEGNDCSVSHVEVLYTIIREYCFTVNANEASGGPDCNTGEGDLPILAPLSDPCKTSSVDIGNAFPNATETAKDSLESVINAYGQDFGIDNKFELQHFLAQAAHESGGFTDLTVSENLNYSSSRLEEVFSKYFSKTDNSKKNPDDYANKPSDIANLVYASRMGNGDVNSGDGYKYRGRGIFQLTGKDNYKAFNDFWGLTFPDEDLDFLSNPDLISTNEKYAILSAMWYYKSQVLDVIDIGGTTSVEDVTEEINGGTNGLDDRKSKFEDAEDHIDCNE